MAKPTVASLAADLDEMSEAFGILSREHNILTDRVALLESTVATMAVEIQAPTVVNKGQSMSTEGVRCGKCSKGKVEVKHANVAAVKACYGF